MIEIIDCEQNSPEWYAARLGIPTASQFATIMASGREKGSPSVTRRTYMHKLAGEIITGEPTESYSNGYMERGHRVEPEARTAYAFMKDCEPQAVGFIRNGRVGASPDSLVGDDGLLEIKSKSPHILIDCLFRDDAPPEHKAQVQGQIWVAGREWCDLAVYFPKMPMPIFRAARDEAYIATLARHVEAFTQELDEVVARIRAWGDPDALRRSLRESAA